MTIDKEPLTQDGALALIAGSIPGEWKRMAEVTGRVVSTVYNWGNPTTDETVPFDCMVKLDLEFQAHGNVGAPLAQALLHQLEVAKQDRFAPQIELQRHVAVVIEEDAEAERALLACALPGAGPAEEAIAIRQTTEAIVSHQNTLALLKRGAGPSGEAERVSPGGDR